jgi:hypothetical protein
MIRDAWFRRDNTSSLDKIKEFVDGWTLTNLLCVVKFMAKYVYAKLFELNFKDGKEL